MERRRRRRNGSAVHAAARCDRDREVDGADKERTRPVIDLVVFRFQTACPDRVRACGGTRGVPDDREGEAAREHALVLAADKAGVRHAERGRRLFPVVDGRRSDADDELRLADDDGEFHERIGMIDGAELAVDGVRPRVRERDLLGAPDGVLVVGERVLPGDRAAVHRRGAACRAGVVFFRIVSADIALDARKRDLGGKDGKREVTFRRVPAVRCRDGCAQHIAADVRRHRVRPVERRIVARKVYGQDRVSKHGFAERSRCGRRLGIARAEVRPFVVKDDLLDRVLRRRDRPGKFDDAVLALPDVIEVGERDGDGVDAARRRIDDAVFRTRALGDGDLHLRAVEVRDDVGELVARVRRLADRERRKRKLRAAHGEGERLGLRALPVAVLRDDGDQPVVACGKLGHVAPGKPFGDCGRVVARPDGVLVDDVAEVRGCACGRVDGIVVFAVRPRRDDGLLRELVRRLYDGKADRDGIALGALPLVVGVDDGEFHVIGVDVDPAAALFDGIDVVRRKICGERLARIRLALRGGDLHLGAPDRKHRARGDKAVIARIRARKRRRYDIGPRIRRHIRGIVGRAVRIGERDGDRIAADDVARRKRRFGRRDRAVIDAAVRGDGDRDGLRRDGVSAVLKDDLVVADALGRADDAALDGIAADVARRVRRRRECDIVPVRRCKRLVVRRPCHFVRRDLAAVDGGCAADGDVDRLFPDDELAHNNTEVVVFRFDPRNGDIVLARRAAVPFGGEFGRTRNDGLRLTEDKAAVFDRIAFGRLFAVDDLGAADDDAERRLIDPDPEGAGRIRMVLRADLVPNGVFPRVLQRDLRRLPIVLPVEAVLPGDRASVHRLGGTRRAGVVLPAVVGAGIARDIRNGDLGGFDRELLIRDRAVVVVRLCDGGADDVPARIRREAARPTRHRAVIFTREAFGQERVRIHRRAVRCRSLRKRRRRVAVRPAVAPLGIGNGDGVVRCRVYRPGEDDSFGSTVFPDEVVARQGDRDRVLARVARLHVYGEPAFRRRRDRRGRGNGHRAGDIAVDIVGKRRAVVDVHVIGAFLRIERRKRDPQRRNGELGIRKRRAIPAFNIAGIVRAHPIAARVGRKGLGIDRARGRPRFRPYGIREDDIRRIAVGKLEDVVQTCAVRPRCGRSVRPAELNIQEGKLVEFRRDLEADCRLFPLVKRIVVKILDGDDDRIRSCHAVYGDRVLVVADCLLQDLRPVADHHLRTDRKDGVDQVAAIEAVKQQLVRVLGYVLIDLDHRFLPIGIQLALCDVVPELARIRLAFRKDIIAVGDLDLCEVYARIDGLRRHPFVCAAAEEGAVVACSPVPDFMRNAVRAVLVCKFDDRGDRIAVAVLLAARRHADRDDALFDRERAFLEHDGIVGGSEPARRDPVFTVCRVALRICRAAVLVRRRIDDRTLEVGDRGAVLVPFVIDKAAVFDGKQRIGVERVAVGDGSILHGNGERRLPDRELAPGVAAFLRAVARERHGIVAVFFIRRRDVVCAHVHALCRKRDVEIVFVVALVEVIDREFALRKRRRDARVRRGLIMDGDRDRALFDRERRHFHNDIVVIRGEALRCHHVHGARRRARRVGIAAAVAGQIDDGVIAFQQALVLAVRKAAVRNGECDRTDRVAIDDRAFAAAVHKDGNGEIPPFDRELTRGVRHRIVGIGDTDGDLVAADADGRRGRSRIDRAAHALVGHRVAVPSLVDDRRSALLGEGELDGMLLRVVGEIRIRRDRDADRTRSDLEGDPRRTCGEVGVIRRELHAVVPGIDGGIFLPFPELLKLAKVGKIGVPIFRRSCVDIVHGRKLRRFPALRGRGILLCRAVILKRPGCGDIDGDRRHADRVAADFALVDGFAVGSDGLRAAASPKLDLVIFGVTIENGIDIVRPDGRRVRCCGMKFEGNLAVVECLLDAAPCQVTEFGKIVAARVVDPHGDGALVDREEAVDRGHRIVFGFAQELRIDHIGVFARGVAREIACLNGVDRKPGLKEGVKVLAVCIVALRGARLVRAVLVALKVFGGAVAVGDLAIDGDGDGDLFDPDRDGADHVFMVVGADFVPDGVFPRVRKRRHRRRPVFRIRGGLRAADDERPFFIRSVHCRSGIPIGEGVVRRGVVRSFIALCDDGNVRLFDRVLMREGIAEFVVVVPIADSCREGVFSRGDEVGGTAVLCNTLAEVERAVIIDARCRSERAALSLIQICARVDEIIRRPVDRRDRVLVDDEFIFGRVALIGLALGEGIVRVVDRQRDGVAARRGSRVSPDVACVHALVGDFALEDILRLAVDETFNAPRRPLRAAVSAAVVGERRRQEGGRDGEGLFKGLALFARVARPARNGEVGVGESERDRVAARVLIFRDLEGDRIVEVGVEGVARSNDVRIVQTAREHLGSVIRRAAVGFTLFDDVDPDLSRFDRVLVREGQGRTEYIIICLLGGQFRLKQIGADILERHLDAVLRDLLVEHERIFVIEADAFRRCEALIIFLIQIGIAVGQVMTSPPTHTAGLIAIDRKVLLLRHRAACELIVLVADGRRDGVFARFELTRKGSFAVERTHIREGEFRFFIFDRSFRKIDLNLIVAREAAVDGFLRHDRKGDRIGRDREILRKPACARERVVGVGNFGDRNGVAADVDRLAARELAVRPLRHLIGDAETVDRILLILRVERRHFGLIGRTLPAVLRRAAVPCHFERARSDREGSVRDVQDEVARVDGNAVRPLRRDGVASRVAGLVFDKLRSRGAFIDELQRACRDLLVDKAAAVFRVVLDVGIFDGSFLPFAVLRVIAVYGDVDRALLDGEGNGIGLRRRVRARLADVTDDVVGADVGRHRFGHILGAVRVGGVAEALFAARDVADDRGLMVCVLPVRPASGVEFDCDDELRAGDLIADRDSLAVLRKSIVHFRFADLRLQPRPLVVLGSQQGEHCAVHAVATGSRILRDGIDALIRVDDEVAAIVRRIRDETVVVACVAVDPRRLSQNIVEVDLLLLDDKGKFDVVLRAVLPLVVGLIRDGDDDGVARFVGVRLHIAGDGKRLAAAFHGVLLIADGRISLRVSAVEKFLHVRGRLFELIARDGEALRYGGRQLVVARARARDLRDFGGVTVARIRLRAPDRQRNAVAVIGAHRLRCGSLRFAVVGEGGVRPGNADLLLRDREVLRKIGCADERVIGVGDPVDREGVAADVDRHAV